MRRRRAQYATALHLDWDAVCAEIRKRQAHRSEKVVALPARDPNRDADASHTEMTVERGALVLRRPTKVARTGWAAAAKKVADAGDDELVMGEFGNQGDTELAW